MRDNVVIVSPNSSQHLAWMLAILVLSPAMLYAQAQPATKPYEPAPITDEEFHVPIDSETKQLVAKLIKQLAAITYQNREKAAYHLIGIGTPAFPQLRTAYHETEELEVSLQIERIIYEGYLNAHLRNKYGFLGIERDAQFPTHKENSHIPEGQAGIRIRAIVPDGGAQRAGMVKGDIILSLDNEPMNQNISQLFQHFAQIIKSKGPGAEVTLKVLRGTQTLDIKAVLGRMPLDRINSIPGMREKLQGTIDRFSIWWVTYFRAAPTTNASSNEVPD